MKPFMITGEVSWNGIPKLYAVFVGPCRTGPALQACLFKAFSSVMTREQAEALAREGIAEYGRIRAGRDGASWLPKTG